MNAMVKRAFSCFLIAIMALSVGIGAVFAENSSDCSGDESCPLSSFSDLEPSAWYHDGVHACLENGLMRGTSAKKFSPDAEMPRGMVILALYRMEGAPAASGEGYDNVSQTPWDPAAIGWAYEYSIIRGYESFAFGADNGVTREQLSAMLYRFAQYREYETEESMALSQFSDASEISSYALDAVSWACANGLLYGVSEHDDEFQPKRVVTRAEAAMSIESFCLYASAQESASTQPDEAEASVAAATSTVHWPWIVLASGVLVLAVAAVLVSCSIRKRRITDDTPLVDYNIEDDIL
jgi:hypothetical protein